MKAELHVPMPVQQAIERIESGLTGEKFIFSEEDASYVVTYAGGKPVKRKSYSRFWSRRELGDKHPAHFSIVVKGTLEEEEKGTDIKLEVVEYHHDREHTYGGTRAIEEYFDKFCSFFQ